MRNGLHIYPYLCSELVTVTSHESSGDATVLSGNLEEIGERNARVLLDAPLPRGAQVIVNVGDNTLKGSISTWSFEPGLGYFVDVHLAPESRWTKTWFTPEHLLRPWEEVAKSQPKRAGRSVAA
jgi:hypothetical protein